MNRSKFEKMTKEPVEKIILSLAVPTIITMMITTIYNTVDTYFAGKINSNSVACVGIVYSFMSIIQAFGFLYGHGSGNFMSKVLGKQNIKEAQNMAGIGILFSLCIGTVIAICTLIFTKYITYILVGNSEVGVEVNSYLRMLSLGIPFVLCSFTINNQFRFQGNALYGMIGMITGGIMNIILDPIFMFFLNMGIKGAGLATSISQIMGFCLLLYLNKICGNVKITFKNLIYSKELIKLLHFGGMPNFARQAIASVAVFLLNYKAIDYGGEAVAAFTVVSRITMLLCAAIIGFGQGFQPVCGYNFGAGLYERVKKAFKFCIYVSTIFFCIVTIICVLNAENIVAFFTTEEEVIRLGSDILKHQCISIPFMGWITIVGMFLQNIGLFKKATIVSAARQGIVFIPLILILPYLFGVNGIMWVQPFADIGTFLISLPMGIKAIKDMK